jgi:hypothetical protein
VKTGGAKPWVYRSVQDCQAAEGLFVVKQVLLLVSAGVEQL